MSCRSRSGRRLSIGMMYGNCLNLSPHSAYPLHRSTLGQYLGGLCEGTAYVCRSSAGLCIVS